MIKSMLPSSIREWNSLPLDIRQAPSKESLKHKLLQLHGVSPYSVNLVGDSGGAINHSRIRMGLSGLNQQRHKYHFIDNSTCLECQYKSENPTHFFLQCPAYCAQRRELMNELTEARPTVFIPLSNYNTNKANQNKLVKILTEGTGDKLIDNLIFPIIHNFIQNTQRFT